MSGPLESITSALISKALDVSLQRHQAIANNVANVDTSGYRPLSVNFDDVMQQVKTAFESKGDHASFKSALASIDVSHEPDISATSVLIDQQMVQMVKNTTHYQALLSARQQFGGLMNLAIRGDRS
ncbi:MAG: flagellar basal-body rod protein FlgB [Halioglobus sp.]|jgi:flagellar basal-body rod protein FlgB